MYDERGSDDTGSGGSTVDFNVFVFSLVFQKVPIVDCTQIFENYDFLSASDGVLLKKCLFNYFLVIIFNYYVLILMKERFTTLIFQFLIGIN